MIKHGHNRRGETTATYRTWNAMLQRCTNPRHEKFSQYGGAGVTVCPRWHEFAAFVADMGERPDGMTIDRIVGARGYEPGNCRWATPKQQQRNISFNVNIEFDGKIQCLAAWAEEVGISKDTLGYRIRKGWPVQKALLTTPRLGNRVA